MMAWVAKCASVPHCACVQAITSRTRAYAVGSGHAFPPSPSSLAPGDGSHAPASPDRVPGRCSRESAATNWELSLRSNS